MSSFSGVGKIFALLGVGSFGCAVGMLVERTTGGNKQQGQHAREPLVPDPLSSGGGGNGQLAAGLSPLLQKTVSKGLPSDERVRVFDGFVASLNYERRIPNWVLEYFPSTAAAAAPTREESDEESTTVRREGMKFFADPTVPEAFRVLPDDYSGSGRHRQQEHTRGLSRGHLAAAQFHKHAADEMAQTFNMNANIVPQDMTMNAVDWLRLENLTKRLRRRYEGGLWVVTGPVFHPRHIRGNPRSWGWTAPRSSAAATVAPVRPLDDGSSAEAKQARKVVCYELVGKHDVAVPTHLFKVVLGERADGSREAAAFLMPNEPIAEERSLTAYQVPVGEVERMTGLQFFPNVAAAGSGSRAFAQGLDALPNICKRFSCEVHTAALFQSYRSVAQLRAAQSVPELQQVYTALVNERQWQQRSGGRDAKLDAVVMKEYEERMKELVEAAVAEDG